MEFVLKALEGIFSIVFIIGIGFVLSRRGWFDEYSSALITRLVTAVSLPLYMIVSISKNFDHNKLVAMAPDLLLPICSMLLAFIVGKLAARIFKIKKERRGIFCTIFLLPIPCLLACQSIWRCSARKASLRSCFIIWSIQHFSGL
ncbi:MAG: AEC family transporter [Acidaminococcaceae bacterium]|nr:AEC family transporter [Acidaminococcaceae bacterium]